MGSTDAPRDPNTLVLTPDDFHPDDPFADFTKLDEKMGRALSAYARSADVEAACEVVGIAPATWYVWRHRYPQFKAMCERLIHERIIPEVKNAHMRAALAGDVAAQKNLLQALDPEFRHRQVIEVVSPDVQRRLIAQADAIMQLCAMELPEPYRSQFPAKLAAKLSEVWA